MTTAIQGMATQPGHVTTRACEEWMVLTVRPTFSVRFVSPQAISPALGGNKVRFRYHSERKAPRVRYAHRGASCVSTLSTSHALHPLLGPQILSNLNPSVADAAGISADLQASVNPCAAILCALPIMSIVVAHRRVAIACLNHRLVAIVTECRCLHRHRSHDERMAAIRGVLEPIVRSTCPSTVVLEWSTGERRSSRRIRDALAEWAEGKGLRVVEVSRHDASEDICGERSLRVAFGRIALRYPMPGAESHVSTNPTQIPIREWEARVPLITALVLAHAVASRALIAALRRR